MLPFAFLLVFLPLPPSSTQTSSTPSSSTQTAASPATTMPADAATPRQVGGDILPPKLTHQVEPKYPRPLFSKAKPGDVLVGLVVNSAGLPTSLHILRSGGAAFDKSALRSVAQYRFSPATEHGVPVPVEVNIDVNFRTF